MIFTIDVGNTNITAALYTDTGQHLCEFRLTTKNIRTGDELGLTIKNFLNYNKIISEKIKAIIIASVVPTINYVLTYACEKYLFIKPVFINTQDKRKLKIPFNIKIDTLISLGADRISNSAGAIARYGQNLIIFDFGTATVCDIICNGDYSGGIIAPGINTSINALHREASLLPFYEFTNPKKIIPTSTSDALHAGIFYNTIGMIEKIVKEIKQKLKTHKFTVIATGGLSFSLKGHTNAIDVYDRDLVNFGLYKIYMYNFIQQQTLFNIS